MKNWKYVQEIEKYAHVLIICTGDRPMKQQVEDIGMEYPEDIRVLVEAFRMFDKEIEKIARETEQNDADAIKFCSTITICYLGGAMAHVESFAGCFEKALEEYDSPLAKMALKSLMEGAYSNLINVTKDLKTKLEQAQNRLEVL